MKIVLELFLWIFILNNFLELCYRTCFKLTDEKYVQFCLDKKCGGATFQGAANVLGYNRSIGSKAAHDSHHGHH